MKVNWVVEQMHRMYDGSFIKATIRRAEQGEVADYRLMQMGTKIIECFTSVYPCYAAAKTHHDELISELH